MAGSLRYIYCLSKFALRERYCFFFLRFRKLTLTFSLWLLPADKTRIIAKILVGTVGNANPSGILEYLLNNRKDSRVTFGEIRNLLTGM